MRPLLLAGAFKPAPFWNVEMKTIQSLFAVALLSIVRLAMADIVIAMGGDIMVGDNTGLRDSAFFADDATRLLKSADLALANLDGPIGSGGLVARNCDTPGCKRFRQGKDAAWTIKDAGIDAVSIANDHIFDMGEEGVKSTRKMLYEAGVQYSGTSTNEVPIFTIKGKKIGFIAFAANNETNDFRNPEAFSNAVRDAKGLCDFLVVSMHMGSPGNDTPEVVKSREERYMGRKKGNPYEDARLAIDSGADLVMGHGPGVPRGVDVYLRKPIFYSLGSLLLGRGATTGPNRDIAPIALVSIDEKTLRLKKFEIKSYYAKDKTILPDNANVAAKLMKRISYQDAIAWWKNAPLGQDEVNLFDERVKSRDDALKEMRRNKTNVVNGRAIPKKGIDVLIAPKDEQVVVLTPYGPMTQKQSVANRKVGGEMKSEFSKSSHGEKRKSSGEVILNFVPGRGTTVYAPSASQVPEEFLNDSPQSATASSGRGSVGSQPQMAGMRAGTVSNSGAGPRASKAQKARSLNDKSYRPNKGDFKNMPPMVF